MNQINDMSFAEVTAIIDEGDENGSRFRPTEKSVEKVYDLFEHFFNGGTVSDFDENENATKVALGVLWLTLRDIVAMDVFGMKS